MATPEPKQGPPPVQGKPSPGGGARPTTPPPARPKDAETALELVHTQRQLTQSLQENRDLRARLGKRSHQMQVLRHVSEILAATSKGAQVASVVLEVLFQEFHCLRGVVWTLEDGGAAYVPRDAQGLGRAQWQPLKLPAPSPFPETPLVLFQGQWLDPECGEGSLGDLRGRDGSPLFFVPFEHQLLLLGFAILALPADRHWEEDELDSIAVIQRQAAVSLYNAWLFHDLSEQRDGSRRQAAELERVNAALREADQLKSEFLALTSHELRTPLTGILGFTRLVMDGLYDDAEEMHAMLQDSYTSGQHLLALLNDILDLAKIESGKLEVRPVSTSVADLLADARPIAEAYPRKEGVAMVWPEPEDLPEVMVDPGRLKQVLLNLLSNACKFTREGQVAVQLERRPGAIALRVVDTGVGVTPEAQIRLFQKFAQADGGHSREYGGTGLGLVICKHLMGMMGGTITLASEGLGHGCTVEISMQIA